MAEVVIWGIAAAGGPTIVAGTAAYVAVQIGVAVATTALSVALAKNAANDNSSGGVRTQSITAGEQMPQSFVLGKYMTAGNLAAPEMSHGVSGDTRYLTRVIDLGDIAFDGLDSIIIDGDPCTLGTSGTLTMSDGDGTTAAVNSVYGPTVATPNRYTGFAWCRFYDGSQTTADADLVSIYGSYPERPWQSDMIGRGVPYAIMTFLWRDSPQIWTGKPDVKFVLRGIKLYDPRKDSTAGGSGSHRYSNQATWEWSENPVVMIYNILRGIPMLGGNTYGGGFSAADLPYTVWAAAMNACDVLISGRKTYIAGYEVKIGTPDIGGDAPLDVVDELLKACSGEIADVGGTIYIRVGGPALPVKFITDDDILRSQPQDLDPFPALENTYNGVHATYPDPEQLWTVREAPPRYDTTAQAEDGGQILIGDVALPTVPNKTQVQQLMKAWLRDVRRMRVHNIALPPEGLLINPLDVVDWTSTRNGYTGKDFEVSQVSIDPRTLCTTLSMREKDSGDYAWIVGDEIATTAPSAIKVQPGALAVSGWTVSATSVRDAGDVARRPAIAISWTTPIPAVTDVKWQVRVQATSRQVTTGQTPLVDGSDIISGGLLPDTQYQVRARYVSAKSTSWTAWTSVTTSSLYLGNSDIAPGSIRVSRLARSEAANLVPDNDLMDVDAWSTSFGEFSVLNPTSASGVGSVGEVRRTVTTGTGTKLSSSLPFTVKPLRSYYALYQVNRIGGTQYDATANIGWFDKDDVFISGDNIAYPGVVTGSAVDTRVGFVTAPVGAVIGRWRWLVYADNTDSAVRFYAPDLRPIVTGALIASGAVTTLYQDTYAGPTALTTTATEYLAQTLPAMASGKVFKRSAVFEARAPAGRTLTIELQSRFKDFTGDPWSSYVTVRTWTITNTAWAIYRDDGTLSGPFEAWGYRFRASIDAANATTAFRNAILTVDETTK